MDFARLVHQITRYRATDTACLVKHHALYRAIKAAKYLEDAVDVRKLCREFYFETHRQRSP